MWPEKKTIIAGITLPLFDFLQLVACNLLTESDQRPWKLIRFLLHQIRRILYEMNWNRSCRRVQKITVGDKSFYEKLFKCIKVCFNNIENNFKLSMSVKWYLNEKKIIQLQLPFFRRKQTIFSRTKTALISLNSFFYILLWFIVDVNIY